MNSKYMHEALAKRKANGLDITILLGAPGEQVEHANAGDGPDSDDEAEAKELGVAPDAPELGEEQDRKDVALGKIGHHANMTPGEEIINHPDAEQDAQLVRTELAKANFGKNSLTKRGGMLQKKAY